MRKCPLLSLVVAAACAGSADARQSHHALRFFGTGVAQQDRVRIPIDDNVPGPDASAPCDVGAGSFTLEIWLRGRLADNAAASFGGDLDLPGVAWIEGNMLIDRDIWGDSNADWGVSVAGGFIRFGTGNTGGDDESTIEGDVLVLDDQWHHVALVRDAATGAKHIYVDGVADFSSTTYFSDDNLSYPNGGVGNPVTPWGPYIVLAAEKHDAGAAYPSFDGYLDEFRIWNVARSAAQLRQSYDRLLPAGAAGLVGYYRFEEGAGTTVAATGAAAPAGQLIAGVAGNGQWVARAAAARNTAPVWAIGDADGDHDADLRDLARLQACLGTTLYRGFDFDDDGAVTAADWADMATALTAPN